MITYVLKRILAMIPTLFGITMITFLIINLAPGDPVATQLGGHGGSEGGINASSSGSQSRKKDAIKAKKKLLGMVREDHSVQTWPASVAAAPGQALPWERQARLPELGGWADALALTPAGELLVGGSDGVVSVLGPQGEVIRSLDPPAADAVPIAITALALTADGTQVVVGDSSGRLARYDLATGQEQARSAPLGRQVRDLVLTPDGRFASACDDGVVRLHDSQSLAIRQTLRGHVGGVYALSMLPDGSLMSAGYDRQLRVWAPATGLLLAEHPTQPAIVNALAVSPDERSLALAEDDRTARVLSLDDLDGAPLAVLKGATDAVTVVAWSLDGARLITGSRDESVRLWDVASGQELAHTTDIGGAVNAILVQGERVFTGARSWRTVPIWRRYLTWLARSATLDFDRSFIDDRLVMDKIADALPITVGLNLIAIIIIYSVSIPLGVLAAVKRGSAFDQISSFLLFLLYSVPNFWLATLLIMSLSSQKTFDLLPSVGLASQNQADLAYLPWLWDRLLHLVLPVTVMVYAGFASLSRYARTTMLETIQEDYVRTARAKGLPEYVVVFKHAFRNSLITIVTLVANLLPAMIGGSVFVEYIFSIQGMGRLGFDSILARDYPVIMAITTFSALLTLFGILVSDILYSVVDPRVRTE